MTDMKKPPERTLSLGEEIANSVSHGIGLAGVLIATPVLVLAAIQRGSVLGIGPERFSEISHSLGILA